MHIFRYFTQLVSDFVSFFVLSWISRYLLTAKFKEIFNSNFSNQSILWVVTHFFKNTVEWSRRSARSPLIFELFVVFSPTHRSHELLHSSGFYLDERKWKNPWKRESNLTAEGMEILLFFTPLLPPQKKGPFFRFFSFFTSTRGFI